MLFHITHIITEMRTITKSFPTGTIHGEEIHSSIHLLLIFLFLVLILIHSLGSRNSKRRGLIHTNVTITHQVQSQLVLTRRRHDIFETQLQLATDSDTLDSQQVLCLFVSDHEPPVLHLLAGVERCVHGGIGLFVFFDLALDLDLEVAWLAGGDALWVFDFEVQFEVGVLLVGEGRGLCELSVVQAEALDQGRVILVLGGVHGFHELEDVVDAGMVVSDDSKGGRG